VCKVLEITQLRAQSLWAIPDTHFNQAIDNVRSNYDAKRYKASTNTLELRTLHNALHVKNNAA
jgi:hypothetical protein